MEIEGVEVDKRFVYVGGEKANVVLRFNNSDGALPKGVVRVYEDGEFVGEDRIDHTPIDEEVDVKIGQAFDIRIEKRVSDSKVGGSKLLGSKCNSSSYEVLIKNHKDVDVVVYVKETPYGRDIEVSDYNFDLEKISENEYEFEVPVEADGESDLEYVVTTCY
jgi:hypothetical protein